MSGFQGVKMFLNIMVPIDGSSFSREGVLQGLRIAGKNGGVLRLVRVARSPLMVGSPEAISFETMGFNELHAAELSDLYEIAAECRAHSSVTVKTSLEHGPICDALSGYARRNKVDLIVMRSHARTGIARAWFGSVADGMIRETGIPVLVVRAPSLATGLESGYCVKRILVPLDGSGLAERSLAPAVAMARLEGAAITLLRVVQPWVGPKSGELASSLGPASDHDVTEAQSYLDALTQKLESTGIRAESHVLIDSNIPQSILNTAEARESDLIVIATHGRGAVARARIGSVADRVMREATISAMVIRPLTPVTSARIDATEVAVVAPSE